MTEGATTDTMVGMPPVGNDQSDDGEPQVINFDVFSYMLDIGEAMLGSGADVHTVESVLVRMGKAYGAYKMDVLVITAVIIVTITLPNDVEKTMTRRIANEGSTNFDRLEALSKLCDQCCKEPMSARDLRRSLDRIKGKPFPNLALYLGGALSAGGFAVFFGGTFLDGIASAVIALLACAALKYFRPITPNTIIFNFATALVTGIIICIVSKFAIHMSIDMAIIGVIMLLIPGVAMTNATRDMLSGDTISGVMRFVESLVWATSLALGFMAAIWIAGFV